mgnify:CR=1 FL=1
MSSAESCPTRDGVKSGRRSPSRKAAAPSPTGAQAPPNAAQADALFTEGYALLEAKSYALACAKFEESQRLDP